MPTLLKGSKGFTKYAESLSLVTGFFFLVITFQSAENAECSADSHKHPQYLNKQMTLQIHVFLGQLLHIDNSRTKTKHSVCSVPGGRKAHRRGPSSAVRTAGGAKAETRGTE